MAEQEKQLRRSFGTWSTLALVVGTVIGTGIFFKQGRVLNEAGSSTTALLAWLAAGILSVSGALTIAEVGSQIPKTGGLYSYISDIYGKFWGFLTGWMQTVFYGPAMISAVAFFAGQLISQFFGLPDGYHLWIGFGAIVLLGALNMLENRWSERFTVVTTSIKLIPIAALLIYGLFFGHADALGKTVTNMTSTTGGSFGVAMLSTLFAYDGWVIAANIAGEIKNPGKTLPRAIAYGMLFVTAVYLLVSYGVMRSLPADDLVKYDSGAPYEIMKSAFGVAAGKLLSIGVLVSIVGTLNSKILSFPRVAFEMADENNYPFANVIKRINQSTKTPNMATLWVLAIATIMLFVAGAQDLSDWAIFITWLFYILAFVGAFILRRRNNHVRQFSSPLFPLFPVIAILGAAYVEVSTLLDPKQTFGIVVSLLVVLIGVPVYYYLQNVKKANR
jgi:APA family basic amino acid/polyamine antiporter